MAHGVLGDDALHDKLRKIILAAGLAALAGEFEAAEGLAGHQRAGDFAVDAEIADAELAADSFDRFRAARI